MTGGKDERENAQAELDARMVVMSAESTAASARIEELALNRNSLENTGAVLDQMPRTPAWQPLEQRTWPGREAGQ
jgi:hypothetical protein